MCITHNSNQDIQNGRALLLIHLNQLLQLEILIHSNLLHLVQYVHHVIVTTVFKLVVLEINAQEKITDANVNIVSKFNGSHSLVLNHSENAV